MKQKRSDYKQASYYQQDIDIYFNLFEDYCEVCCKSTLVKNPEATKSNELELFGKDLELISISLDAISLKKDEDYFLSDKGNLSLKDLKAEHKLEIRTKIYPHKNKSLEGLYKTSDFYCTQNEPDGFRRITYFLDRPDNMATYTCHIEADKKKYPVLLSNGNLIEKKVLNQTRHLKTWSDPFKKPSYLFAMVAGQLDKIESSYTTHSGRKVLLEIYSEKKYIHRLDFAMQALKDSMKWDEERFGLEYDLDRYMIVVSDDFNAGAMENKGLNIFNSKYVLASPETATETDYYLIQSVIAHEYFHNYSGNRVTCRDWFQLSLKEGFTVFRDQEFTSDLNSRAVKRIEDVNTLRASQFPEDSGPNSHPVRPEEVQSIANFYSATIYEKGAELIRMIHSLIGEANFKKGSELYFKKFDGQAVTCDDFVDVMEEVSDVSLEQFRLWYEQSGTPEINIEEHWDSETKKIIIKFGQKNYPTNDQTLKKDLLIPCRLAFFNNQGNEIYPIKENSALRTNTTGKDFIYLIHSAEQSLELNFEEKPVASYFRSFSAPVNIKYQNRTIDDLLLLASYDTDLFNRFEAINKLKEKLFYWNYTKEANDSALKGVFSNLLNDPSIEPSFKALCLGGLDKNHLVLQKTKWDLGSFKNSLQSVEKYIACDIADNIWSKIDQLVKSASGKSGLHLKGQKDLMSRLLQLSVYIDEKKALDIADQLYTNSKDFSSKKTALSCVVSSPNFEPTSNILAKNFVSTWSEDKLVINQYIKLICSRSSGIEKQWLDDIFSASFFDTTNPNNLYNSVASFASNFINFHENFSWSYKVFWQKVLEVDKFNPQVAGRLASCMEHWSKFGTEQESAMKLHLNVIDLDEVSDNLKEIIQNNLKMTE